MDHSLHYELYTDGACQPNPGIGGWAYLIRSRNGDKSYFTFNSGSEKTTTNNRMELQSVLEGLKFFKNELWTGKETIHLFSDSQYTVKGISIWIDVWQSNNWKKKRGKILLNSDLWEQIWNLRNKLKIRAKYIPGHAGNKYNEIANQMAVKAVRDSKINITFSSISSTK